jgi:hypothetical protein
MDEYIRDDEPDPFEYPTPKEYRKALEEYVQKKDEEMFKRHRAREAAAAAKK